jgi:predicted GNAT superfamily acetyltransferase
VVTRKELLVVEITPLTNSQILIEVNNSSVPDVNFLDEARAGWLVSHSLFSRLAMLDGRVAGVLIALSETAGFDSDYYRWYVARYKNFIYVDWVVVAAWARGLGVATELYHHLEHMAEEKGLAIAAEVYSDPPNVPSLNLHRKLGYQEVGTQFCEAEGKRVCKFMKYAERAGAIQAGAISEPFHTSGR